jgi:hypothetical protein
VLQAPKDKKKEGNNPLAQLAPLIDEKSPRLLFVDALTPIELVLSFYSMSRWYEQRLDQIGGEGGGGGKAGGGGVAGKSGKKTAAMTAAEMAATEAEAADTPAVPPFKEFGKLEPGSLMAEAHSWKSLQIGQPLLRIHTTAIRSAFLRLAPGRHVLRLVASAPIAYHLHVVSNCKFVLGDEDEIMPRLTDDSCRFIDQAMYIFKSVSESIKFFSSDKAKQREVLRQMQSAISPTTDAAFKHPHSQFSRARSNSATAIMQHLAQHHQDHKHEHHDENQLKPATKKGM